MFIVIHCGGMPFNGETIKTKSLGGSETAAYYMARELAKHGHRVTMFTNSQATGIFEGVRYEWAGNLSEHNQLGDRFSFYAENTPHDVLIIQRHYKAFQRRYASKVNLWWCHDLALKRFEGEVHAAMVNIDAVLTVSEFHKRQVVDTWGLNPDVVRPIQNGVDLSLYDGDYLKRCAVTRGHTIECATAVTAAPGHQIKLLYSSRPERGLENHVKPGGIMERLWQIDQRYHLYVCAYDNVTPQMREYYDYLYQRIEELPNCTNLGALTKQQLADVMRQCDALVYPTKFEEVSCITAMEAMAAGLPFISSAHAALPETCQDSGSDLLPLLNGEPNEPSIINSILSLPDRVDKLRQWQLAAAPRFSWNVAANKLLNIIEDLIVRGSDESIMHHFMRMSDMKAFDGLIDYSKMPANPLADKIREEWAKGYAFYRDNTFAEHYAAYYDYEKNRGVNYGPEDLTGNLRFEAVANFIADLPSDAFVLDYGCAHGHYTINLAKRHPTKRFIGVDIAESNVLKARAWAESEGLTNVEFVVGDHSMVQLWNECWFDAIIAAEVVEHVAEPRGLVDGLCTRLTDTGYMIITTPYGPWEAQGYRQHGYWRAHLHHFERADLHEMFAHHPQFNIIACPSGPSEFGHPLGSYITIFKKPTELSGVIDYARKLEETVPDQTIAACLIVKDGESDIRKCLQSVVPFVQQVIIGVDSSTTDGTFTVLRKIENENPLVAFTVFSIEPVSKTGFAAARNSTITQADADWILWIDSDEVLYNGDRLCNYMRHNQYSGYAIKQHHITINPPGVMKTDMPCRVFRNHLGVRFFGVVHEHPELSLNEGIGHVIVLPDVQIAHHGYATEDIRRGRFSRNLNLLVRDRKENPDRILGKYLWIRDLAQLCQYEIQAGNYDPRTMEFRARDGIKLWRELVSDNHLRLAVEALPFYSDLCRLAGDGVDYGFKVGASKYNGGVHMDLEPEIQGHFAGFDDAILFMNAIARDKTKLYDTRYF